MKNLSGLIITITIAILIVLGVSLGYHATVEEVTVTVTDKERISEGFGKSLSHKFLVYTENEVFENTDITMYFKFNSTDVQNNLKVDSTYTLEVVGWRIPFFSSYRNIIEIRSDGTK